MKNDLITKAKALLEGKQLNEKVQGFNHPDVTQTMLDAIGEFDGDDVETLLQHMISVFSYDNENSDSDTTLLIKNLKTTLRDWKGRHGN